MLTLGVLASLAVRCSGTPKLPPGLPPPEYERPAATPWPPVSASAKESFESAPAPDPIPAVAEPAHPEAGAAGQ
jgi:hypothetical protein